MSRRWQGPTPGERPVDDDGESEEEGVPFVVRMAAKLKGPERARALILLKDRQVEHRIIEGSTVHGSRGSYGAEARGMYWNREWIPPGLLAVYSQDDPEPVHAEREPRGYNAVKLEFLTGDYPLHTMSGGLKSRKATTNWLMLAIAAVVGGALVRFVFPAVFGG